LFPGPRHRVPPACAARRTCRSQLSLRSCTLKTARRTDYEGLLNRFWRKLAALPGWVPIVLAAVLVIGVLTPITHTGFRGDDSHVETDLAGARKADHVSLWHQIGDAIRQEVDIGRPEPVGAVEGNLYAAAFQGRFVYKAGIALLSLASLLLLAAFLRMFRVGASTLLIVAVAFALSLQYRLVHDPALGYYSTFQFIMLVFFAGLIAYLRFLRGGSGWWYVGALVLVVLLLESYEANYPLVVAFAALHLGRDPARIRSWRYSWPILGLGAAATLLSVFLHSTSSIPTAVSGYSTSLDVLAVVETAVRQTVSGIPDIYFLSGSQGLLANPTKAEMVGALWRAGLAALLIVVAFMMARREPSRQATSEEDVSLANAEPFGALQIASVGFVLMAGSGLFISLAKQWQDLIVLGTGHLATFANTLGFVLIAAAVWIQWRRALAAYTAVIALAAVAVFGMALAGQYSNLRIAAVEQPGIQQRDLFQDGLDRGVLDGVEDTTIYLTNRDMNWTFGNLVFYGGTSDYFVYLHTGRMFDVRTYPSAPVTCGPPMSFPVADCAIPSPRVALLAVRASKGGGVVILADGIPERGVATTPPRRIVVIARGASARGAIPQLVGQTPDGKPWSANQAHWIRTPLSHGWMRYTAIVLARTGPVAPSLTDTRSPVDFSVGTPVGKLVRWFGTKNLLP
jgi:hypothetical protein